MKFLSLYVLRASITEGRPIEGREIYRLAGKQLRVNMDKSGFVEPALHRAFIRQIIDEFYQALMRIGVRRYDDNHYNVVVVLPSPDCIAEVQSILPGVRMESTDRVLQGYLHLLDHDFDSLARLTDNELRKKLGGKSTDAEGRRKALTRVMAAKAQREPAIFLRIRRLRKRLDEEDKQGGSPH